MRYVRPFDIDAASPAPDWLVAPQEEIGCAIRIRRGGGEQPSPSREPIDRFALVLAGSARLIGAEGPLAARTGDLIFIPAGTQGAVAGDADGVWADIEAVLPEGVTPAADATARVITVDPTRFEGQAFAYQSLIDRSLGAQSLRMNVLQVQPGGGSPDWHIHAFAQIYIITEGEMTVDIGNRRQTAKAGTLIFFPAGVVHRNFNASAAIERHVTLLVPEPQEGAIFDYAVSIHQHEAELLKELPL